MALSEGFEFSHVYDANQGGHADEHWITTFAKDGGEAIVTADSDFHKRAAQVVAVFNTGMKVIHLPPKWGNAKCHLQAAHILLWWGRIERCLTSMAGRECYRPPWDAVETGKLVRINVDFQAAHRKFGKGRPG
jgi:hypothetical protein